MSLISQASALVLFAFAALPFAACTGSVASQNADNCSQFCKSGLACLDPKDCVLADPAGAEDACATACDTALAAVTSAQSALVDACLSCMTKAAGGMCFTKLPAGTCDSVCNSADAKP